MAGMAEHTGASPRHARFSRCAGLVGLRVVPMRCADPILPAMPARMPAQALRGLTTVVQDHLTLGHGGDEGSPHRRACARRLTSVVIQRDRGTHRLMDSGRSRVRSVGA